MDMASAFASLNWFAVIVATVATFVLGYFWYSPMLFGKAWMEVTGMTPEKGKQANMGALFGGAFLFTLISAINLGMFLGPKSDLSFGIAAGAAVGIGWIATAIGVTYLFEQRPRKQWYINSGYWVVAYVMMGAIIGAWH